MSHHFERSEGQQGGAALAAGPAVPVGVLSPLQDELLSTEGLALIAHPANRREQGKGRYGEWNIQKISRG